MAAAVPEAGLARAVERPRYFIPVCLYPHTRYRTRQGLHGHGAVFHVVADAGVRVDDDLVGQPGIAPAVHLGLSHEALAERPVLIHQRHADR